MNILMVTSECFPFAKTGGLADAVASLSKELVVMGHDARVIMPRYYKIDRTKLKLTKKNVWMNIGYGEVQLDFYETTLPASKVPIYFIDFERAFGRAGIYGENGGDFGDNPFRFMILARAAFELCKVLNWAPDIMHAHDWPASLTSVFLKYVYKKHESDLDSSLFQKTHSVLTIHNMGYQGQYSGAAYQTLGLPNELLYPSGLEQYNTINFLKAGITCSAFITTVSPGYAAEIQTGAGGFGLDGLMRVRSNSLFGILNGADTTQWNPLSDTLIAANYSPNKMAGKAQCKEALQRAFNLKVDPTVPIVGMVTRLAEQKGIAEVFAPCYGALFDMCDKLNMQFVVLGSGEGWCENEIRTLTGKLTNMGSFIGYNESLSHLIEAGSDYFLMPSKYEPCGLNQIYSMLYGTPPIVHKTGGLADTVRNIDAERPTGLVFNDLTPQAVFGTVKAAVDIYYGNKTLYQRMQHNGMTSTFSWEQAAKEYLKVYSLPI